MKMEHGLSCYGAIVAENVESLKMKAFRQRSADNGRRFHQPAERGWRDLQKCLAMLLWKDQRVTEMNRPFVKNANRHIILEEDLRRGQPIYNAAKYAVRHPEHFSTNETELTCRKLSEFQNPHNGDEMSQNQIIELEIRGLVRLVSESHFWYIC
jgi:hypothetical protein